MRTEANHEYNEARMGRLGDKMSEVRINGFS